MLLDEFTEVKLSNNNIKHYVSKGYDIATRMGSKGHFVYDLPQSIIVKTIDIYPYSVVKVNVKCDYCGTERVMEFRDYYRRLDEKGLRGCNLCKSRISRETNMKKYGVEYITQVESIKEKVKATNLKLRNCEWAMSNKDVQEKRRKTFIKKYGHEWATQNPEVMSKTKRTLYEKQLCETSNQQKYIYKLYGGKLNYPFNVYNMDILLDNIDIEYDGGAHNLGVILGSLTEDEFKIKEIIRSKCIKSGGYKIMKIISSLDKLPTDEILVNMLEISKSYFNSTNHTWIEWYIDENKYRNAENRNGSFFDYGITRRIYKKDITEEST
jgi:spore coat protein CotF